MPEKTITIDRYQRDGLYELVRNHLASVEDFWVALERTKDFARAERPGAGVHRGLPPDAGPRLGGVLRTRRRSSWTCRRMT